MSSWGEMIYIQVNVQFNRIPRLARVSFLFVSRLRSALAFGLPFG